MLGKLMKYEFLAMGRVFIPLFGALLLVSIVNSILGHFGFRVSAGIGIAVSVILMVGIAVIVLILTLQRFWTNLLTNEGYLMMTLPTGPDNLILSKLFVATIWGFASAVVVTVAILIMAISDIDLSSIHNGIRYMFSQIPFTSHQITLLIFQFGLMLVLGSLANTLMLYACMALSMLVNKYRALVSFGAFIGITTVLQIIMTIIMVLAIRSHLIMDFESYIHSLTAFSGIQIYTWITIVFTAILCALFYLVTRYMLKRRLNLQ
ncbi:MAG: hypothetical protein FWC66_06710 [Oscillospiraceae bacterium]|nr:hypothetical protein [Oscillospiraceae bacterium]